MSINEMSINEMINKYKIELLIIKYNLLNINGRNVSRKCVGY